MARTITDSDYEWFTQLRNLHSAVNEAINRAGIHYAVTFPEAIDIIAKERNEAVANLEDIKNALYRTDPKDLKPIPMIIFCPACDGRHIDEGEFATKPHHTHACQHCGHVWRPALVHTVGVQFLPGFKNEDRKK